MNFILKGKYNIDDLRGIMEILRSPEGCPWDREQDHKSIRSCFIEETYEAVEAIDTEDTELLKEELGDVLLQVLFHSEIEKEQHRFDFDDVVDGIAKKMVIRHPHVFGSVTVKDSGEVLTNWDAIKKETKSHNTQAEVLRSVSVALPSLMRSAKVQHKAAKAGFDWPNVSGAFSKVEEELDEVRQAAQGENSDECREELGDLLFAVVNVSRFLQVEPEQALSLACNKFIDRFTVVEQLAKDEQIELKTASIEELDELWKKAKQK